MTLTLELPSEIEAALRADAAAHDMDAAQWVLDVIAARYGLQKQQEARDASQRELAASLRGKYAGIGGRVDNFLREKHEEVAREIALEEERDRMRALKKGAA